MQTSTLLAVLVAFGSLSPLGLDAFLATRMVQDSQPACCNIDCGCANFVLPPASGSLRPEAIYYLGEVQPCCCCFSWPAAGLLAS